MRDVLHLAGRYLAAHRVLTSILVFAITLIVFLPVGLQVLVRQSERELTTRAAATPLILGRNGSPLELTLNSLYFAADTPPPLPYADSISKSVSRNGFRSKSWKSQRLRATSPSPSATVTNT